MMGDVSTAVRSSIEDPQVAGFLTSAASRPTGLIIEGQAGIGKTTLWWSLLREARDRGFRVLTARVGQTESVMAFAALADLLGDLEPGYFAHLPGLQRLALDRVLLRAGLDGPATDQRVVAAGLVAVLHALAAESPVIDHRAGVDRAGCGLSCQIAVRPLHYHLGGGGESGLGGEYRPGVAHRDAVPQE